MSGNRRVMGLGNQHLSYYVSIELLLMSGGPLRRTSLHVDQVPALSACVVLMRKETGG
jgi:hypothetical protein